MSELNCKASVGCLVYHGDELVVVYEEQDGRGAWDIPAGGIEAGEIPEEALRRELQEEIGLQSVRELRLIKIFWATLDVPTVHFLYALAVDDNTFQRLQPMTADIQKIASFSRTEIQKLLDTEAYEHNLAKARLQLFLSDKNEDKQFACVAD